MAAALRVKYASQSRRGVILSINYCKGLKWHSRRRVLRSAHQINFCSSYCGMLLPCSLYSASRRWQSWKFWMLGLAVYIICVYQQIMDLALENLTRRPQGQRPNQNQGYARPSPQFNSMPNPASNDYGGSGGYQQPRRQMPPSVNNANSNPNYAASTGYKPASQPRYQEQRNLPEASRSGYDQQEPNQRQPQRRFPPSAPQGGNDFQQRQFRGKGADSYEEREPVQKNGNWNSRRGDQQPEPRQQRDNRQQRQGQRDSRDRSPHRQISQPRQRMPNQDYQNQGHGQMPYRDNANYREEGNRNFRGRGRGDSSNRQYGNRIRDMNRDNGQMNQQGADRSRGRGRGRGRGMPFPEPPEQKFTGKQAVNQKRVVAKQEKQLSQSEMGSEAEQSASGSIEQERASISVEMQDQESKRSSSQELQSKAQQQQSQSEPEQEASVDEGSESSQIHEEAGHEDSQNSISLQKIDVMCSKEEFEERVQIFKMNNRDCTTFRLDTGRSFAIFQINKRSNEPDYALTLKRYRRSTNRAQEQQQNEEASDLDLPRSRKGLQLTIRHIQKYIIDADNIRPKDLAFPTPPGDQHIQFLHIYDFLWNRTREMIKDVSRLELRERCHPEIVEMCEQMLRFFILAVREGRLPHQCKLEFDAKMNLESITKILTQLLEIYESAHQKYERESKESNHDIYISPHEPEVVGYAIIISNDIQNTLNEKLMIRLNGRNVDHPLFAHPHIQTALAIKRALRNRDYQTYYRILESQSTDYILACLMLHHLPMLRAETLRVVYRSSEQQPANRSKRTPEMAFRRALRFKVSQNSEFYEFLSVIGGKLYEQFGESYVFLAHLNDRLEDCPAVYDYRFEQNKLARSNYPDCKENQKRLVKSNVMSREQLTKRNWYSDNYVQEVAKYYRGEECSPTERVVRENIKPAQVMQIQKRQEQKQQQISQPVIPVPDRSVGESPVVEQPKKVQNLAMLLAMKKGLTRKRFLTSLQTLIKDLIRTSDIHCQHQRIKSIKDMMDLINYMRVVTLHFAFNRITEHVHNQKMVICTLKQLEDFAATKRRYLGQFNSQPYQFREEAKVDRSRTMSSLLRTVKRSTKINKASDSILKELFKISVKEDSAINNLSVLFIFTSEAKRDLTARQMAFLHKFYSYFLVGDQQKLDRAHPHLQALVSGKITGNCLTVRRRLFQEKEGVRKELQCLIKLFHYRFAEKGAEEPFIGSHQSIVFIDLHKDTHPFLELIRRTRNHRAKLLEYSHQQKKSLDQLKIHFGVFHLGSLDAQWFISNEEQYLRSDSQMQNECHWWSSWHFLQFQSLALSGSFKNALLQFLSQSFKNPLGVRNMPQLGVRQLSVELQQIEVNFQFVGQQLGELKNSGLLLIQEYFNLSLECLQRQLLSYYDIYETYNWRSVLLEASYLRKPQQSTEYEHVIFGEERVNLNTELHQKLIFSLEIVQQLKMNFVNRYIELMRENKLQFREASVLAEVVEEYLQGFDKEMRHESLQMVTEYILDHNCSLRYDRQTVTGDCRALFSLILNQIKKRLMYITIILPKDFRFKISKERLLSRCIPKPPPKQKVVSVAYTNEVEYRKPKAPRYCRADLLQSLQLSLLEGESQLSGRKRIKGDTIVID